MAAYVILRLGGVTLRAAEEEAVAIMRALGKEEIGVDAFTGWLEKDRRRPCANGLIAGGPYRFRGASDLRP